MKWYSQDDQRLDGVMKGVRRDNLYYLKGSTCRLSKNHWRQVVKKSRIQTPEAGLVIAISAAPRREGWNPRLDITAGTKDARVETRVSVLLQCQDAEPKARVSCEAWRRAENPRLSSITLQQNARLKTCVSVVTALITGSITTNVVRG